MTVTTKTTDAKATTKTINTDTNICIIESTLVDSFNKYVKTSEDVLDFEKQAQACFNAALKIAKSNDKKLAPTTYLCMLFEAHLPKQKNGKVISLSSWKEKTSAQKLGVVGTAQRIVDTDRKYAAINRIQKNFYTAKTTKNQTFDFLKAFSALVEKGLKEKLEIKNMQEQINKYFAELAKLEA